jgi:anti-sigma factor RsiW
MRSCQALDAEGFARAASHLAACADCRRYAEELQATSARLRGLAEREIEPSADFHARWCGAVEVAARRPTMVEAVVCACDWWRCFRQRNWRPLLGLAPVWVLTLLLRFSTPEVSPSAQPVLAHSPVEIFRALRAQEQFVAQEKQRRAPVETPHKDVLRPRSEGVRNGGYTI